MSSHDMRTEDGKHYKIRDFCDDINIYIYIYSGVLFLERKIVRPTFTRTSSFLMPNIQIQEIGLFESDSETEQLVNVDSSFVLPYAHITLILILLHRETAGQVGPSASPLPSPPGATQKNPLTQLQETRTCCSNCRTMKFKCLPNSIEGEKRCQQCADRNLECKPIILHKPTGFTISPKHAGIDLMMPEDAPHQKNRSGRVRRPLYE